MDGRLPGGSRELLVPNRGTVSRVTIHPTKQTTFNSHRPLFRNTKPATAKDARVGVNKEFFRQLGAIFKIIIPRATSKEVFLVVAHTSFLLLRTYLSLLVAQLDGKLVGDLVRSLSLSRKA
jgi:ATP-binding cassette subfamily D (ALD) long-chain fatty acid import protein